MTPAIRRKLSMRVGDHSCSRVMEHNTRALSTGSRSAVDARGTRIPERSPGRRNASRSESARSSNVANQQASPAASLEATKGIDAMGNGSPGEREEGVRPMVAGALVGPAGTPPTQNRPIELQGLSDLTKRIDDRVVDGGWIDGAET